MTHRHNTDKLLHVSATRRVEDLVIVTDIGCENLNILQQGLDWG
ncbi:MAG: hypothetical protein ACPG4Q_06560 [Phycisphaeraceae bacterium]